MWRKALLLTAALVFVGFGAVVISLFRWQIVRGEEMSIAALDQSLRSTTLSAMRGTIYDATGKVLAQSASVWTVVLEPASFADYDDPEGTRQKVASGLAAILDMDEEEVYEKTQGSSYFVYLKRRVETSVRDEINEFLEAEGISSGVRLIEDYKRYYPSGTVASTVLGFTGTDGQGLRHILPGGGEAVGPGLPAQQVEPAAQLRQGRELPPPGGEPVEDPAQQGVGAAQALHAPQPVGHIVSVDKLCLHGPSSQPPRQAGQAAPLMKREPNTSTRPFIATFPVEDRSPVIVTSPFSVTSPVRATSPSTLTGPLISMLPSERR